MKFGVHCPQAYVVSVTLSVCSQNEVENEEALQSLLRDLSDSDGGGGGGALSDLSLSQSSDNNSADNSGADADKQKNRYNIQTMQFVS